MAAPNGLNGSPLMPELPEVETVVRGLRAPLAGRTITGLACDWPRGLSPDVGLAAARIAGQPVRAVNRRAKYIVITLDPIPDHPPEDDRAAVCGARCRPG
jgi:formamidopyrimidine-DNA glycosylase